jgi:hypothetical protein
MTNNQENKLTMYEAVQSLLDANSDKTTAVPAFAGTIAKLKGTLQGIKSKATEVEGASAGKVATKNQAEDELLNVLMPVSSALFVLGGAQKDLELKEKANVSESALRKMRDTELVGKASLLLSLANQRAKALGGYGISPEMLTDLEGKISSFSASIGQRESSVAERVGARANLLELFDVADRTLTEELDRMMELVRGSQTQFYNEYFAARVIKDLGTRHRPAQQDSSKPNP